MLCETWGTDYLQRVVDMQQIRYEMPVSFAADREMLCRWTSRSNFRWVGATPGLRPNGEWFGLSKTVGVLAGDHCPGIVLVLMGV